MSDKKSVLSTDDLAPRPRAVNEAAASQITGGVSSTPPKSKIEPSAPPTKPPPPVTPALGKKP